MATTAEGFIAPGAELSAPGSASQATVVARRSVSDTPVRAEGLEFLGTFEDSGHREAPALVRRADGQIVQLTPLLYALLAEIDGRRNLVELAQVVGDRVRRALAPEDVWTLVESKLRPLGVLQEADGSQPEVTKANPLLALRFRMVITNPRVTGWIARLFSPLFWPPFVIAFSLAFAGVIGWLLFDRGLAGATRHALYEPQLLLLVVALMTLSAGFHELGHAAACRYSGARPGAMGAGLYIVWPAFYTDVSDAYRLARGGRLRVDLGGIYFNAIFALGAYGLWVATGWEALLLVVPFQAIAMIRQLIPLVRLDGYHILADLTGVPDLFAHIKPILRSVFPWRWGKGDVSSLKPWVRVVVTAWVLLVIPILGSIFVLMILTLPRVIATAFESLGSQWDLLTGNLAEGNFADATLDFLTLIALVLPAASVTYLVSRVVRRTSTKVWRSTEGRPVLRGIAAIVAASMIAGLLSLWWPNGQYRAIEPQERGTLASLRGAAAWPATAELLSFVGGAHEPVWASYDVPDAASTTLAVEESTVGTPAPSATVGGGGEALPGAGGFPFPLPAPPGEGDNQALAVNTTDGSSLIDLALSLVFMDGEDVDNTNEAYALASCIECLTVAIAFQVVVILDEGHDVIPENVAAAINVACVTCVTQAVAIQLVVTLSEPLSEAELAELEALWAELERLEAKVGKLPLDEIYERLTAIQADIDALLDEAAADDPLTAPSPNGDDALLDTNVSNGSTEEAVEPSASPSPTATPTSSPTPTASPSPSESPSPSSSPTSSSSGGEPTPEP